MADEQPLNLVELAAQRAKENDYKVQEYNPQGLFEGNGRLRNPTLGDAFDAALETGLTDSIGNYIAERRAASVGPKIDAKAVIKSDPLTLERFNLLPKEYQEKLEQAQTQAQLTTMLTNAERNLHYQQVIQNSGTGNAIAAQIAAGFLDPTEVLVGVASGGLGNLALKGRTLGKVAKAGITALEGGVSSAAVTAAMGQQDPTISTDDILASLVVGGVLGAPFGAMSKTDTSRIADKMGKLVKTVSDGPQSFSLSNYMARSRAAESSGSDIAAATTSSAYGRYQFLKDTWVSYYKKTFGNTGESRDAILAKRADGTTQDRVMETYTRENAYTLQRNNLPVNDASVYLMHFLGEGDALKVLKSSGSTDVKSVVRAASRKANAAVFAKVNTVEDLVNWAARKMKVSPFSTGGGLADEAMVIGQSASSMAAPEFARMDATIAKANEDFNAFELPRQPGSIGAAAKGVDDVEYFGAAATVPGSYAKYLGNKVPAEIRQTFASLMHSLSRTDNEVRDIAAETTARRIHDSWLSSAYQGYNPHFRAWAKERGIGLVRQELGSEAQQDFMREVTRAMRGDANVSPQAKAAGDVLAENYRKALMDAKRAGIPGFEDVNPNTKYVPRLINERKLMEVYRKVGLPGIQKIIRRSLIDGGMDEALANRVSKAYAEGSVDRAISPTRRGSLRGLAEDDIERLRYYLPEDDPELVDDVISSLKNFREARNPDGGRMDRAKFRLNMDELAEEVIDGQTYRVTDLFEDDAWQLYERYSRSLSGWIGLAERANIRSDSEWDQLVNTLKTNHAGDTKIKEYLSRLNEVKDLVLGRSIVNEGGTVRRTAQVVRKLNFARTMGQAGMASLAELGNVVAYSGMKNMMMHMPLFRNFWRQAKDGTLDKQLVDEIQAATGIGMKLKLGRGRAGVDEFGDPIENHIFDTVDRMLDPFQRAVSYVGLLGPMNDFLQMLASRSFVQKLGNAAKGKYKFTQGEIYRLRDAGFHDGVLERVLENINTHGTFDGKRIVGLGLDKWDRQIAADFKDVLANMTYRAVQENDIGSSAWWMHTGWGRMLTQFRSFVMNALIKQTLYSARFAMADGRPDGQVWAAFALTMFFGGLSYTGRQYLNSIGQPDPEAYRQERIGSLERIALNAFNSTGYASIIPGSVDTIIAATGNLGGAVDGPLFAMGRTTGLGSDILTGNPTYDLYKKAKETARLPFLVPQDSYQLSQTDVRKAASLLPLNNVTGVRNMIAFLNQDLPEHSQEDEYWK